ncbi:MAG: hypothetical protein IJ565_02630 [Bacilli bacterium]|nr:hypothetical protein [Bacilli bacterium]
MNTLERYRNLSNEDKGNLTIYTIYNSIHDVIKENDAEISDEIILDIQELAYDIYIEDTFSNVSASSIGYFITECYVKDNQFLEKIDEISYDDILSAIENDNYDFYKDNLERGGK